MLVLLLGGSAYATLTSSARDEAMILEQRLEHTRHEIKRLKAENRRLHLLIMNMDRSDQIVEKIAREDAGLVRKGELLFVFPE